MWIHTTLADDLMDMVMVDNPTAYCVWKQINDFFNTNKASRVVHLEADIHNLEQGDMSARLDE
jgi:sensor domain CHASE-containing protein